VRRDAVITLLIGIGAVISGAVAVAGATYVG
jgi:hypothetical protein